VAHETIDNIKKEKKSGVFVKVDFEKTYDSMDWGFLVYMMVKLGFNNRWIKWGKTCLESATGSVLVNGSPTDEFRPIRGLRQGDPLAPFLFLIVAERLTGLVRKTSNKKLMEGVQVGTREIQIDILQLTNDMLFFCHPSYDNMLVIKAILRCFKLISRLRVNFHKSRVGVTGVSRDHLRLLAKCLNCTTMGYLLNI